MKSPEQFNIEAENLNEQPNKGGGGFLKKIGGRAKDIAKVGALSLLAMASPGMTDKSEAKSKERIKNPVVREKTIILDDKPIITFKLDRKKDIVGYKCKPGYEEITGGENLLKSGWFELLRKNMESDEKLSTARVGIVNTAAQIFLKKKVLKELEKGGEENSLEAKFLKKEIFNDTENIRKNYGNILRE